jgi:hypothetical protein
MTIVAQDPSVRRNGAILTAKVSVPAEDLERGPLGYRVHVVDYDASERRFHGAHALPARYEDEPRSWRRGGPQILRDFRFHAQNVYALVMKTLARFEFALGRRIGWSFETHQLKVAPHGMRDANAFYSPAHEGLVLGHFDGGSGPIYTALSHDIVVHETTHALLDALRERYMIPSNPDQAAFHEALGDIVALLSVFSLPEVVNHLLAPPGGGPGISSPKTLTRAQCMPDALRQSAIFGLAEEMGQEIAGIRGEALRKSAQLEPSPALLKTPEFAEAHRRGEIFVAAVMRGFIDAWSDRIIASGTTNQKAFPVARIAEEGADIADALATLWIRAIDYMPPVHLTFSDALTAALTSDTRVRPDDSRFRLRHHLKRTFAQYGIRPVSTTPAGSDCWAPPPPDLVFDRVRFDSLRSDKDEVFRFLWENRVPLELRTDAFTKVLSVRPCVRMGPDGFVLRETVAEYYQVARLTPAELEQKKITAPRELVALLRRSTADRARRRSAAPDREPDSPRSPEEEQESILPPLYGGGVLIFDEYGQLRFHIHNDVFGRRQAARLAYLWQEGLLRIKDGGAGYRAARLSTLHRLRAMDSRRWPAEGW